MRPSFKSVCARLAAHNCYMAGASVEDVSRQAKVSKGVARKWIAEVARARTGTSLPIDKVRDILTRKT